LEVLSGLQLLHVSANSPQKSGAGDQLNMDSLVSMLTRVKILVHELDPDAEEVALNLRQALHGSSFYETANLLHHQIEETEFDAAEETLKQLQSALQASEKEENIR
jgi:hypothetical protein